MFITSIFEVPLCLKLYDYIEDVENTPGSVRSGTREAASRSFVLQNSGFIKLKVVDILVKLFHVFHYIQLLNWIIDILTLSPLNSLPLITKCEMNMVNHCAMETE